jgi:asparagine synthase (glutamine-hydrolysing)
MFEGIHKLMPGHTLELDETGHLTVQRYWDSVADEDANPDPPEHYVKKYRHLLEGVVSSHLMSDVPVGVLLSGGLDSSAIAALCTKIQGNHIQTFSVGYGERAYSELGNARRVADHIQSEHHEILLSREEFFKLLPILTWHEDEPIAWPSSVPLYVVARMARACVKVVLTGEGSDETLGGYRRYALTLLNVRMNGLYSKITPSILRRMLRDVVYSAVLPAHMRRKLEHTLLARDSAAWESFYFDNFYSAFSNAEQSDLLLSKALGDSESAYSASMLLWEKSTGKLLHRMLYTDINSYLIELLMKQDQMSMAASIESRVPFLDHLLVEFTARIPGHYNIQGMDGKCVLKKAVEDILPKSIIYQRKLGFPTPWEQWITGEFLDDVEKMLVGSRCSGRRVFKKEAVKRLFVEQRAKKRDHSTRIWRLLSLEVWFRIFLDGEVPGVGAERGNGLPEFYC